MGRRPPRTARPCSRPETRRSPAHGPSCSPERLQHHQNDQQITIELRLIRDARVAPTIVYKTDICVFPAEHVVLARPSRFWTEGVKSLFLTLLTGLFIELFSE